MGAAAMRLITVEQLGFAMIPLWVKASAPLTSGTTRGTPGSRRKAELLSMYTASLRRMAGAQTRLCSASTAPRTKSRPAKAVSVVSWTGSSLPAKGSRSPAERRLASRRSSAMGSSYSSRIFRISRPTAPVAPRIPIR